MTILEHWLETNKMNIEFQKSELCRIFGLNMVSANGIISFTGGDGSPMANYLVGKAFNFNLDEIAVPKQEQVPTPLVVTVTKVEESGITAEVKPAKDK